MKRTVQYISLGIMLLVTLFFLVGKMYDSLDYPPLKSTTCLHQYSREELDFFSEVGFLFRDKACKWEDDILISMEGMPMDGDGLIIDEIVKELSPLIEPVKISRVNGLGNLVVKFTKDTIVRQTMGFTQYEKMSFNGHIKKVEIEIFSKVQGQARQACMRHEFLHALGLGHPSSRNTGTLIESLVEYLDADSDNVRLYKFAAKDQSSIKILYSDCIPKGLKRKTFLKGHAKK